MAYRILIVEDETILGLDLADMLEEAGFETVGIARDMASALRIAQAGQVDLATMDVQLARGSSGIDTALKLRQDHGIPCLFVSASLDDGLREKARLARPVGFVDKPAGSDAVVGMVKAHFAVS